MGEIRAACDHKISSQPFGIEVRNIHNPRYLSNLLFADNAELTHIGDFSFAFMPLHYTAARGAVSAIMRPTNHTIPVEVNLGSAFSFYLSPTPLGYHADPTDLGKYLCRHQC
jgi:hypothetical protein